MQMCSIQKKRRFWICEIAPLKGLLEIDDCSGTICWIQKRSGALSICARSCNVPKSIDKNNKDTRDALVPLLGHLGIPTDAGRTNKLRGLQQCRLNCKTDKQSTRVGKSMAGTHSRCNYMKALVWPQAKMSLADLPTRMQTHHVWHTAEWPAIFCMRQIGLLAWFLIENSLANLAIAKQIQTNLRRGLRGMRRATQAQRIFSLRSQESFCRDEDAEN